MAWSIIAAISGGLQVGSSIFGATQSADAAQQASQAQIQAAQQAQKQQLGIFNQVRNDLSPYNTVGQGAINALASYWGLPQTGITTGNSTTSNGANGLPSGADSAATINLLKQGLQSWDSKIPGNATGILNMINQGATLPQIQSALASLRTTTTNPQNTAFLDPLIQQANNPVMGSGTGGTTGASAFTPGAGLNGANAFNMLQQYPGYQFQYDQGLQALNRNLAAGGRYTSGAMLKDAQTFGQGQAQSSVNNYLSMLQYLGSLGENAGATVGNAGVQTGQGVASSIMSGGTAAASGITGAANAFNSGVGGVNNAIQGSLQNALLSSLFNNQTSAPNVLSNGSGFASYNPGGGYYTPGAGGFNPNDF